MPKFYWVGNNTDTGSDSLNRFSWNNPKNWITDVPPTQTAPLGVFYAAGRFPGQAGNTFDEAYIVDVRSEAFTRRGESRASGAGGITGIRSPLLWGGVTGTTNADWFNSTGTGKLGLPAQIALFEMAVDPSSWGLGESGTPGEFNKIYPWEVIGGGLKPATTVAADWADSAFPDYASQSYFLKTYLQKIGGPADSGVTWTQAKLTPGNPASNFRLRVNHVRERFNNNLPENYKYIIMELPPNRLTRGGKTYNETRYTKTSSGGWTILRNSSIYDVRNWGSYQIWGSFANQSTFRSALTLKGCTVQNIDSGLADWLIFDKKAVSYTVNVGVLQEYPVNNIVGMKLNLNGIFGITYTQLQSEWGTGFTADKLDPANGRVTINSNHNNFTNSNISGGAYESRSPEIVINSSSAAGYETKIPKLIVNHVVDIDNHKYAVNSADGVVDSLKWKKLILSFGGNAVVGQANVSGPIIRAANTISAANTVKIGYCNVTNRSWVDMAYNGSFDNWFFGELQGITIEGGLYFYDNTCFVKGSRMCRLYNANRVYGVYNRGPDGTSKRPPFRDNLSTSPSNTSGEAL